MNDISRIWPQYQVEELLGQGSFGKVYKVRKESFGIITYAAVKVINIPWDDTQTEQLLFEGMSRENIEKYYENMAQSFFNENVMMEQLKGAANIVTIEDFYMEKKSDGVGWSIYIRMELLCNLPNIQKQIDLYPEDIAKLGSDICEALKACEQKHIVHRDIKPENIFINEYGIFKLGDFGIARSLDHTRTVMSQKGTSMYIAPEIYRNEAADHRVDIYSLGIMLYRLANHNRFPFMKPSSVPLSPGDKEEALLERIKGKPLKLPCGVDGDLGRIIIKACAHNPNERYQSAEEMQNDLKRWLNRKENDLSEEQPKTLNQQNSQQQNSQEYLQNSYPQSPQENYPQSGYQQNLKESYPQNGYQQNLQENYLQNEYQQKNVNGNRVNVLLIASVCLFVTMIGLLGITAYHVLHKDDLDAGEKIVAGNSTTESKSENVVSFEEPNISDHLIEWDCVYYGSYPQDEVIERDEDYHLLVESEEWDGDLLTIDGDTYCRMQRKDALYYNEEVWSGNERYRYFKYQPIKWRVLKDESGEITLISNLALDTKMFNRSKESANWENSDIRSWLNNDFLNTAFSDEEQKYILKKSIENAENPIYHTNGGEATEDKIILMSYDEIALDDYGFSGSGIGAEARRCAASSYAKVRGVYLDEGYCSWWLRTSGDESTTAVRIFTNGQIASDGSDLWYDRHGVRPVITLSSDAEDLEYAGTVEARY